MLSILIPTYNYPIYALVSDLKAQCDVCKISYEIISYDDGSENFHEENNRVNELEFCSYTIFEMNIGRSQIRNLLAKNARYDHILFLDADVMPVNSDFIQFYIGYVDANAVVTGGLRYQEIRPENDLLLRWIYGSKREAMPLAEREKFPYQSLLASNFMVPKLLFNRVLFNVTIPDLRREDTLFSYEMMVNEIQVLHIENPVFHLGLDTFEIAIRKEKESLQGLHYLLKNGLLPDSYLKMSRLFNTIKKWRMISLLGSFHNLTENLFLRNLSSEKPSLLLFDLYRIGYLCAHAKKFN